LSVVALQTLHLVRFAGEEKAVASVE